MLIWAGLGFEIVLTLLIIYTSLGNWLFGSAPQPAAWQFMLPLVMALLEGRARSRLAKRDEY